MPTVIAILYDICVYCAFYIIRFLIISYCIHYTTFYIIISIVKI